MAITNGYATLDEMRDRLGITDPTDTSDDATIERIVQAVSRQIDDHCKRRFFVNATDETRDFTAVKCRALIVDDLVSVTTLATDPDGLRAYGDVWVVTDYDLWPYNAALKQEPYLRIEATPNGNFSFPLWARGVRITGKFGWVAVPDVVHEACLVQSERAFKWGDAPFGVMGSSDTGIVRLPPLDAMVRDLLQSKVREEFA